MNPIGTDVFIYDGQQATKLGCVTHIDEVGDASEIYDVSTLRDLAERKRKGHGLHEPVNIVVSLKDADYLRYLQRAGEEVTWAIGHPGSDVEPENGPTLMLPPGREWLYFKGWVAAVKWDYEPGSAVMAAVAVQPTSVVRGAPYLGYNNIGTPGDFGFGAGVCPPCYLPEGVAPMLGTTQPQSANYGNYLNEADGSVMVYVPAYWYRIGHPENKTFAEYGPNSVDIEPLATFADRDEADLQGFAIERAFVDGGNIQLGFFYDKYRCSNNGGVASSLKNGDPLSARIEHNPFSELNGEPENQLWGALVAAKTRGEDFFCANIFMAGAISRLSLAHAQAATAPTCAWFDPAGVTNFPKGCNNDALRDANDTSVLYLSDGYLNCGKTGSGEPFDKTTHNGQTCGIADVNGLMWEIAPGLTSQSGRFYTLKEAAVYGQLGGGASSASDLWGTAGLAANYDDAGETWGALQARDTSVQIGSESEQVFSGDTSGLGWHMTGAGIPLEDGLDGSNDFGRDRLWDYRPNNMCPRVRGRWGEGTHAGSFARTLNGSRSTSTATSGFRSALWPVSTRGSG